jgi:hypothetical protein
MELGDQFWLDAEIHREHGLIAHRMNWYVASQSFLLTAYAIANTPNNELSKVGRWLLPLLAMLVSLVTWFALGAALKTMAKLRREQGRLVEPEFYKFWYAKRRWAHAIGSAPPVVIPILFFVSWAILWTNV